MTVVLKTLKSIRVTAARWLPVRAAPRRREDLATQTRDRLIVVMCGVVAVFSIIQGRLVYLAADDVTGPRARIGADMAIEATRPRILDRNGQVMALDIETQSLFAEPKLIERAQETYDMLATVLPDLPEEKLVKRLKGDAGFIWVKRELTPRQQADILALGLPGIGFRPETKRYYPGGATASHILGHTNIDNQGIAGIEKHLDDSWLRDFHAAGFGVKKELKPVQLSVDMRVQHFVRQALVTAMEKYRAIAAAGVVLDANTGEVIAMSSLPDYDPNNPVDALKKDRLNRMSAGLFEMGSTFKTFTTAMALDSGKVNLRSRFDATKPLRIGRFTINDFHGKRRVLSVPEVFIYSSNIGTAKMADVVGIPGHKEFLTRIGLLDKMQGFELPEVAKPTQPKKWKKVNSITISYGHGVSTTPLQTAVAAASLVNGGRLIPPTLFPRSADAAAMAGKQVLKPQTTDAMRYLMRLNVLKGSGKRSDVPGFLVGGKTGTAEKVVNGRYSNDKRFNAFLATFPVNDPRYIVLVIVDEPKPEKGKKYATAGMNAAPVVGEIVRRSAPLLGVEPDFRVRDTATLSSYTR
ncbi:penicillin-binding protein 2 [Ahrensia sp. R2A130]|uniref:peptidoglycan D,D-transpeptidase FtsI family protein n=1 Tax=Ahrensia sp. R2A130 TaxID=744979 RepID=UPI0001E0C9CF|nr:penicillin-binding protein 2 [Ahrensia sp. R2A130]EFL90848.1 penicillin-binding protein 2 [Ahrensia sp. R2A130]